MDYEEPIPVPSGVIPIAVTLLKCSVMYFLRGFLREAYRCLCYPFGHKKIIKNCLFRLGTLTYTCEGLNIIQIALKGLLKGGGKCRNKNFVR
jgi:hypothetical protein